MENIGTFITNHLKAIVNTVGAFFGLVFGAVFSGFAWTPLHTTLVLFMVIDYVSGLFVAAVGKSPKSANGGLSSKAGFEGLIKKGFIIIFVLMGIALDVSLQQYHILPEQSCIFQTMIICLYIANEGLSILENATLLGMPIPAVLIKALEVMRDKASDTSGLEEALKEEKHTEEVVTDKNEPPDIAP